MDIRLGINGFGRIGKCILRLLLAGQGRHGQQQHGHLPQHPPWLTGMKVAMINSNRLTPQEALYLYRYDSVHGGDHQTSAQISGNTLTFANHSPIIISQDTEPAAIPWDEAAVDVVLECTGKFNSRAAASKHCAHSASSSASTKAGAESGPRAVVVSAPCTEADATVIMGVNDQRFFASSASDPSDVFPLPEYPIISAGSCTTNCLLPVLKVIADAYGISQGYMTTIHSYTNDQSLIDSRHTDRRRGRAGSVSIIPTTSGVTRTISAVMPELQGRIAGSALRVPTPNVSLIDLTVTTERPVVGGTSDLIAAFANYAQRHPQILSLCDEDLVSIDFCGRSESAIVDLTQLHVSSDGHFLRVAAWYDNELAFAMRMLEICHRLMVKPPAGLDV